ncbi:MAG: peptidase C39 [Rubripirellula sp.]|nr:peptidase C39 [Rubripirellula sp.]
MVGELLIGVSSLLFLCFVAFRLSVILRGGQQPVLFSCVLLATLWVGSFLSGRLLWAKLIPSEHVLFISNLTPLLLSVAAGFCLKSHHVNQLWRPLCAGLFLTLACGYIILPCVRPVLFPIELSDSTIWKDNNCLQSHPSSCAPAAAVTLLNLKGCESTEQDLARWCLTSGKGTEALGLYRGLNRALAQSSLTLKVAPSDPSKWMEQMAVPNICLVRLGGSRENQLGAMFFGTELWNASAGSEGHAVVVRGQDSQGCWIISDPAFGETLWSDQELQERFTGEAIYLTSRD